MAKCYKTMTGTPPVYYTYQRCHEVEQIEVKNQVSVNTLPAGRPHCKVCKVCRSRDSD
jgi:hypothetical protein